MSDDADLGESLAAQVRAAAAGGEPLAIVGGATKRFFGRAGDGAPLAVAGHRGIVSYAPTELVVTARAGTPLSALEAALAEHGQMLPFEPPHFGAHATLGGTIACGLSGPRRPYAGAARDFVLGVRLINGRGEILRFGGEVMKNVAGYDLSRLVTGSLGTLGVLLEVSLKVLPRPAVEQTLAFETDAGRAVQLMNEWAGKPLPLSATCHDGARLYVRLSGTAGGVGVARSRLGGEALPHAAAFWDDVREQRHAYFREGQPLWRLSLPSTTFHLDPDNPCLIEWGGAQRWLHTDAPPSDMHAQVHALGGHATLFRGGDRAGPVFQPPSAGLMALHRRLKEAFDPGRILNPGRMFAEL